MTNFMAHRVIARFRYQRRRGRVFLVAVLVASVCTLLVSGSSERSAAAQSETQIGVPATGNIEVRDGTNSGEVVISWDYVPDATHYRIGYVNLDQDYALPGSQHGYRVRMWVCEADAVVYGQDRLQTLRSFRAATQPSTYYGQFLSVKDVVIKAKDTVNPDALYAEGDIVSTMLSGRQDIGDCMANVGAGLAIIKDFPDVFESLEDIYGGAVLAAEYRERRF